MRDIMGQTRGVKEDDTDGRKGQGQWSVIMGPPSWQLLLSIDWQRNKYSFKTWQTANPDHPMRTNGRK